MPESNPKIENTLLKMQCLIDLILKKQVETDTAIIELRNKSERQSSYSTPNSGQARREFAGSVPGGMVDKMNRNFDLIYGKNESASLLNTSFAGDIQDLFSQDSRVSVMFIEFCYYIIYIYSWSELCSGVYIVVSAKAELNIAANLIKLNGNVKRALIYLGEKLILDKKVLCSIFEGILNMHGNYEYLALEKLKVIFEVCSKIIGILLNVYIMDGKDDAISPTLMCHMLYPFWMLRSAIVIRFIKKEIWVYIRKRYKATSEFI